MTPMRTVPDPTPPKQHHLPFHFPPSPPPSADATAPSSPLLPVPDTPRRHIHLPRDLQTARKVADSLQLFRESEEGPTSGPALAKRRFTTSHPNDGVEEARYEFVKRGTGQIRKPLPFEENEARPLWRILGPVKALTHRPRGTPSLSSPVPLHATRPSLIHLIGAKTQPSAAGADVEHPI
jgi:hypothetical protein